MTVGSGRVSQISRFDPQIDQNTSSLTANAVWWHSESSSSTAVALSQDSLSFSRQKLHWFRSVFCLLVRLLSLRAGANINTVYCTAQLRSNDIDIKKKASVTSSTDICTSSLCVTLECCFQLHSGCSWTNSAKCAYALESLEPLQLEYRKRAQWQPSQHVSPMAAESELLTLFVCVGSRLTDSFRPYDDCSTNCREH